MTNLDELLSLTDMEATQKLVSEGFTVKDIYKIGRMLGRIQGKEESLLFFNDDNNDDNRLTGDETDSEADEHRGSDDQAKEVNA